MSEMITVASGFQYSVNIGYDLNNDDKLKNFIPTQSALSLLEDILLSTNLSSNERARVLIGAYGKGKSHIVLTILSMLMKKDQELFVKVMPKIKENKRLYQCVQNYYESENKILPVVISGSNTSLTQAFLLALQRTLSMNNLLDVMPETNYKAAANVIERWKSDYPEVYKRFCKMIDSPVQEFINKLKNFNVEAYEMFEKAYPSLSAGSVFNPFLGFDVVELYEEAVRGLRSKGYTGIYVIYDEFSKFLEANITEASVSDTKMLQDFSEKCNRSGKSQLHLMLISHKEISNYIDKLPKQKVDGWRGVSERFKHIHMSNNFTQTYEIIESAIQKEKNLWNAFNATFKTSFDSIVTRYKSHNIFKELSGEQFNKTILGCYPLHPVSTYILPRLSERVAQNERTLFTFISAPGVSTLPAFLDSYQDDTFTMITPDLIYDYFEPLFKKEVYSGSMHENYVLTEIILDKLEENSLESKLIKTLSLIYILEQFEKLQPSKEELISIYSMNYDREEIGQAIENLIAKEYVIYLKRSNNYLRLKQTSGVDINQKIKDLVAVQSKKITVKDTLNNSNFDNFMYPSRYNSEHDMIRYFAFEFIEEDEISESIDWNKKCESIDADGVIYGVIPKRKESIPHLNELLKKTSSGCERVIFIMPKTYHEIASIIYEFNAVSTLKDSVNDDKVLFEEYEVIYEDLREVIDEYLRGYTRPEEGNSRYIYAGEAVSIKRKSALTELMSGICDRVFSYTPVISNEAINKNEITSVANNSRNKIISALLRNELEPNLGLSGTGQEVSIMRSTLVRTGILEENEGIVTLNLSATKALHMDRVLKIIEDFINETKGTKGLSFGELYRRLTSSEYHIGLRKGLIPIYIAVVIHEYKSRIIITDSFGPMTISLDTMLQINAKPEMFTLSYLDWDDEKEEYVNTLEGYFSDYILEGEKVGNLYDHVVNAMKRWYMALPKYVKNSKVDPDGQKIEKKYTEIMSILRLNARGSELLFEKIPTILGKELSYKELAEQLYIFKKYYDTFFDLIIKAMAKELKILFATNQEQSNLEKMSMSSVIKDWCESLDQSIYSHLFENGTEKVLNYFKTITNDDASTITRLAKMATDLRLDDWDEKTKRVFLENMKKYKLTAEKYHSSAQNKKENSMNEISSNGTASYQLTYIDASGEIVTKCFEKVEGTGRGRLLHNQVTAALDSMGRSISDQEKRQILMEILKKLC